MCTPRTPPRFHPVSVVYRSAGSIFPGLEITVPMAAVCEQVLYQQQACLVAPDPPLAGQLMAGRQPSLLRQELESPCHAEACPAKPRKAGRMAFWVGTARQRRRAYSHSQASTGPRPSVIPLWFSLRIWSAAGAMRQEGAGPHRKTPRCGFQPKSAFTFDFGSCPMVLGPSIHFFLIAFSLGSC